MKGVIMVLSKEFEQLSLIEQENLNGGELQKGDFNKAAAAAALSAALCPQLAPALLVISAACWLADATLPASTYHSSGGGKF